MLILGLLLPLLAPRGAGAPALVPLAALASLAVLGALSPLALPVP